MIKTPPICQEPCTDRRAVVLHPQIALLAVLLLTACQGDTLRLVGSVERTALELAAPISEEIVELPAKKGERVEAGQVVVRLDTEVASAELRAFEAALAAAQALLKEADREYARQEQLSRSKVATPQALDRARRQRDEAQALVAEKEARIAQANKRLRDLTVTSRAAGIVDQLPFEVGERVPAGGVVAVVVADERPWVRVWLPSRAVARVQPQTPVAIEVEGFEGTMQGEVDEISREAEFTPHYALTEKESAHLVYETRITITDAPADLRSGLPARVRIDLPPAPGS